MKSSPHRSWLALAVVAACRSTPDAPREDSILGAPPAPPSEVAPSPATTIVEPAAPPPPSPRAVERLTWAPAPVGERSHAAPDEGPTGPREPSWFEVERRARAAFSALTPAEQLEVCQRFAAEADKLRGFQQELLRFVLASQEREASSWPLYSSPPWFDPAIHAPAQPIARTRLDPASADVLAVRRRILGTVAPRRLRSAWLYDYAARELRRLPDESEPQRIFDNGLLGALPQWDLAEALVERALDDGALQKSFTAFAHAYTDRTGGVYPDLTLYDAWSSRTRLEMPDVDCLGIVHDVLGDWETWKAVVPDAEQAALYRTIRELFQSAQHHRSLRHNLARAFLCGTTELRDGYQHNLDRFHALWESVDSDPRQLVERLPAPEGWAVFLQSWADELDADLPRFLEGVHRRYTLDLDAQRVRETLLRVLDELGAYQRLDAASQRRDG